DERSRPVRVCIGPQDLLVQRTQVGEVRVRAQVFLGDLQFQGDRRAGKRAEQRARRLAWLKIERPVLHLDDGVAAEPSVERLELLIQLAAAIRGACRGD